MRDRTYGLGIDVGDSTVVAAVCRHDGDQAAAPELLPLGRGAATGSAAVALVGGRLSVLPPPGPAPAGALVEHVVRRVGAPTPLLGSSGLSAAAAVAAIAVRAHELATRREGGPAAWSVLTVPPSWGSHRRDLLATALSAAGLPRSSVVSAAEAVVRRLVAAGTLPAGATVAVYDLGAGSLDTAVLRTTAGGDVEQLAVPPAPLTWGGRDLDDAVVGHVVGSLPGGAAPTHPAERAALRRACTAAKEALSTETDVRVDVRIDGVPAVVRVVREDVEDLVAGAVEASVDVLRSAVAAAGLPVEDLAAVVLAGGSTRVPLVAETLSAELGRPLLTDREPASSAACGAALLAVQQGATVQQAAVDAPGDADAVDQPAADAGGIDGVEDHGEAGTGRPLPRRLRRPPSAVDAGDGSTTVRRHLQRAAVLTTAVLALWAGSASLVTLVDPEGAGAPLGASTADADAEPARGPAPADAPADPAGGDVPAGSLTPAALERASAGDGDPRSAPSSGVTPGTATRAAAGAVRSPSSSPGPAPAGSSSTSGGSGPTPGTPTAPQPGTGTGTATGGEAPVPTPPGGTSTPPAGPSVEPGPDPDPDPEPKPEPEPTTDPEPTPPDPRPTPPDPQPDPVDPPASTTSPADVGAAAGQAA